MEEKLNTLTGGSKRKYKSESFDSREKQNASTYAQRQNIPQPSSSRNQATEQQR